MRKRYLSLATAVAFSLGLSAQTHASEMTSAYQQYQQAVSTGDTAQTLKFAQQALEAGQQKYASDSDNLFALKYNVAAANLKAGNNDAAVEQFEALTELATEKYGALSIKTLATKLDFYSALTANHDERFVRTTSLSRGELLIIKIMEDLPDSAAKYPADRANMYYMVASKLLETGQIPNRIEDVKATLSDGLAAAQATWGEEDLRTLSQRQLLGQLAYISNELSKAVALLEPLTTILESKLAYTHPVALQIHALLEDAYTRLGDPEKASYHGNQIAAMKPWQSHMEPLKLTSKKPEYPFVARGLTGNSQLEVVFDINPQGRVQNARIKEGTGSSKYFEKSALEAVQQWRYTPRFVDGEAVTAKGMAVSVNFEANVKARNLVFNMPSTDYVRSDAARLGESTPRNR